MVQQIVASAIDLEELVRAYATIIHPSHSLDVALQYYDEIIEKTARLM